MIITQAHGGGGKATSELIRDIFFRYFDNEVLKKAEDSAVVGGSERIAVTTDSFVVDPIEYDGGDIGRLSVCGTVNDLLAAGAKPKYLTCGFILQEGLEIETLERIVSSMADTAKEAGVSIIAGDTKVTGGNGGLFINTSGIGYVPGGRDISAEKIRKGDLVILSGCLGEHHAAILKSRMNIKNRIISDNAPLVSMAETLFDNDIEIHAMRDVTRGGLATVLSEMSQPSKAKIEIFEDKLPENESVKGFCSLLGLETIYMGNEGKMVFFVPSADADRALELIRKDRYGKDAAIIGRVNETGDLGCVLMKTSMGGTRRLEAMTGEGLPRIC